MAVGIAKVYALPTLIPRAFLFDDDCVLLQPHLPPHQFRSRIAKAMCSSPYPSCGEGMWSEPPFLNSNKT